MRGTSAMSTPASASSARTRCLFAISEARKISKSIAILRSIPTRTDAHRIRAAVTEITHILALVLRWSRRYLLSRTRPARAFAWHAACSRMAWMMTSRRSLPLAPRASPASATCRWRRGARRRPRAPSDLRGLGGDAQVRPRVPALRLARRPRPAPTSFDRASASIWCGRWRSWACSR